MNIQETVAAQLLQIKAIKLQPANPFTWASGWKSPIYCDNRKTLSFPEVRDYIKTCFAGQIKERYPEVDVVAGVATGAIAQGALVADVLNKPFIYIRSAAKGHGLESLVERLFGAGRTVVIIGSVLATEDRSIEGDGALRGEVDEVLRLFASFPYGFATALENFEQADVGLFTMGAYDAMLKVAAG